MKKLTIFLILIMFGFGVVVQTVHSDAIIAAPNLPRVTSGPSHNARLAIAPYAQVVPNNSYTFIGVTHPSLATAHTSIGLIIEAMDMTTAGANNSATRAVVFTINAGETHRVFIVNQGHDTITVDNDAFNNANTHLIATSEASNFGNIRVTSVGSQPNQRTHVGDRVGGHYGRATCSEAAPWRSCRTPRSWCATWATHSRLAWDGGCLSTSTSRAARLRWTPFATVRRC